MIRWPVSEGRPDIALELAGQATVSCAAKPADPGDTGQIRNVAVGRPQLDVALATLEEAGDILESD